MRKFISCLLISMFAWLCFVGDWSGNDFIIVDSQTNIAYYTLNETAKSGKVKKSSFSGVRVVNVQVNDIRAKTNRYIFPLSNTESIESFIFEEKINKDGNVVFKTNSNSRYGTTDAWFAENNNEVTAVSGNIFIRTYDEANKLTKFYLCDKKGNNLRNIYKYGESESVRFYLDAKLKKIIFIKQVGNQNVLTEIDY